MPGIERWRVTPQYAQDLADPVAEVFRRIEDEILVNIARYFKGGTLDRSASLDWQAAKLAQLGKLTRENMAIIARHIGEESGLTAIALERVLLKAVKAIEPELAQAAEKGLLTGQAQPVEDSVKRQLSTYAQQAVARQNMVNTAMLNSSLDQYRTLVFSTAAYERALDAAQRTLNARTGEVITGVSSRQQAVRKAIQDMARQGLTGFTDRAGRQWSPEAYVNMDIRTTAHNVAVQAVFNRCDEYGLSLVEVSSHAGARPRCEPFQGRIYDRNNNSGTVKDLNGQTIHYSPWSSTSYGEAAGLLGINCGHFVYPFIPEWSVQTYAPTQNKDENDRLYQQSQQQRQLERNIRAAKRESACLLAAGDEAGAKAARGKVQQKQAALREFLSETGCARRRDREQVYGYQSK